MFLIFPLKRFMDWKFALIIHIFSSVCSLKAWKSSQMFWITYTYHQNLYTGIFNVMYLMRSSRNNIFPTTTVSYNKNGTISTFERFIMPWPKVVWKERFYRFDHTTSRKQLCGALISPLICCYFLYNCPCGRTKLIYNKCIVNPILRACLYGPTSNFLSFLKAK